MIGTETRKTKTQKAINFFKGGQEDLIIIILTKTYPVFTTEYIQVHLKKCEYHEKGQYFLPLISKSETHILYRFITHGVKYFMPFFLKCWWLWLTDNENPKFSVSEN